MSDTQNGTPNAAQPAPKAHKLDKRNPWRKVIILVVILLIFGPKNLPKHVLIVDAAAGLGEDEYPDPGQVADESGQSGQKAGNDIAPETGTFYVDAQHESALPVASHSVNSPSQTRIHGREAAQARSMASRAPSEKAKSFPWSPSM